MPFIPHTQTDIEAMLQTIGVSSIEDLFSEIPAALKIDGLEKVPSQMSEMETTKLMKKRAAQDHIALNFAGAGAYEHHIPSAIWQLTTRGEFYSAYTPYQAEASQGTLQLIYEYQSMMTSLLGMDVSNASMYDGATAMAEAVLMAERLTKKGGGRVLVSPGTHPAYVNTLRSIVSQLGIDVEVLAGTNGLLDAKTVEAFEGDASSLIIAQPNYYGLVEDVDALTDAAHAKGLRVIAVVNPMVMSVLKPPGQWGAEGVDIACGEGQPLGVPLSSGGPYFGFMACRQKIVRELPGRIVGRTVDLEGKEGFTLTLQAREQHIRRAKAKSNICTNQGLLVTAATIYMALMGPDGLQKVATQSASNMAKLDALLTDIPGVEPVTDAPYFLERAYKLPKPARDVIEQLAEQHRIVAGVAVQSSDDFDGSLLVCTTETKSDDDLKQFAEALKAALV